MLENTIENASAYLAEKFGVKQTEFTKTDVIFALVEYNNMLRTDLYNIGIQEAGDFIKIINAMYNIDITEHTRRRDILEPRQIVQHILFRIAKMRLCELGRLFKQNHATIIHSIEQVDNLISVDKLFMTRYKGFKTIYTNQLVSHESVVSNS